jgi:hypothetical protein
MYELRKKHTHPSGLCRVGRRLDLDIHIARSFFVGYRSKRTRTVQVAKRGACGLRKVARRARIGFFNWYLKRAHLAKFTQHVCDTASRPKNGLNGPISQEDFRLTVRSCGLIMLSGRSCSLLSTSSSYRSPSASASPKSSCPFSSG